MKSAFRARYMIMGGWGTNLFPRRNKGSRNGRGPPEDRRADLPEQAERKRPPEPPEDVMECYREPRLGPGDQLREASRMTRPPVRWRSREGTAGQPGIGVGEVQRMAILMAMMALGASPTDKSSVPTEAVQEQENLMRDQLAWVMSWCNGCTGGETAVTGRTEIEASADGDNGSAPRGRESAGNGSRPLSGEDRELLH